MALMVLLIAATFVGVLSTTILVPGLPDAARWFAASYYEVQWAVSIPMLAAAAALFFIGPLADRYGRRSVILCGLCSYTLGAVMATYAWSTGSLVLGRVVQGVGAAAVVALPRAAVRDVFKDVDRVRGISMVAGAQALAPAMAQFGGAYLVALFGWRGPLAATAVLGALILVWFATSFEETLRTPRGAAASATLARHYASLLAERHFFPYCFMCGGSQAGFFALLVYAPRHFIIDLQLPVAEFAWLVLLAAGSYFIGTMLSVKLAGAISPRKLAVAGATLSIGGISALAALGASHSAGGFLVPMMLYCVGHGVLFPNAMHGALQVQPQLAGSASALVGIAQFALGMAATFAMGAYATSVAAAAIVMLACAALVWAAMILDVRVAGPDKVAQTS